MHQRMLCRLLYGFCWFTFIKCDHQQEKRYPNEYHSEEDDRQQCTDEEYGTGGMKEFDIGFCGKHVHGFFEIE